MTTFTNNFPHSSSPSLLYQREQITQTCCFISTLTQTREHAPSSRKQYAKSASGKSKQKKINLLIAKKGVSLQKGTGISLSKHVVSEGNRSCKIIRSRAASPRAPTTLGSREVTQKNSLSSSRMHPEQMLKIQRNSSTNPVPRALQAQQGFPMKNGNEMAFVTTRDMSSMHLLSDITLVEQQFISHGSTTLNALNYLYSHAEKSRFSEQANGTIRMISNYPVRQDAVRQFRNPLERLNERKKLVL